MTEAEIGVMFYKPRNTQECRQHHQLEEAGRILLYRFQVLTLWFSTSGLQDCKRINSVKSPSWWHFVTATPGKLIQYWEWNEGGGVCIQHDGTPQVTTILKNNSVNVFFSFLNQCCFALANTEHKAALPIISKFAPWNNCFSVTSCPSNISNLSSSLFLCYFQTKTKIERDR